MHEHVRKRTFGSACDNLNSYAILCTHARNYMGKWLDNQHTGECLDKTRKQKQKQREGEGEGAGEGEGEGENKSVSESERKSPVREEQLRAGICGGL